MANVEPANERNHVYRFSTLPQSETEANLEDEHVSISTDTSTISNIRLDEIFIVKEHTCQKILEILGLTILMMLIFFPLYRRLGSPKQDPTPPLFVLNSMYISNFSVGAKGLSATWDAKFTITNKNVSSIYFRKIDFTLFYKHNPEDALSVASSYPFYLDEGEFMKLHLKFMTLETDDWEDDQDQPFVEDRLVEEISKDRAKNNGSLSFGMQMKVQAIYYGETWVSDVVMTPYCEDLMVQFFPNKVSGKLVIPNRNFSVPIQWKPLSFF